MKQDIPYNFDGDLTQEEFENFPLDIQEDILFEQYLKDPCGLLMEMANIIGNDITIEGPRAIRFSFYFSTKQVVRGVHGIRVKILWNPAKFSGSPDGTLALHGNYEYTAGSHKYRPTVKELQVAKDFFKKYKVLFAAYWEEKLSDKAIYKYFCQDISFEDMVRQFDLKGKQYMLVNKCHSIEQLEKTVRENKIFNMND